MYLSVGGEGQEVSVLAQVLSPDVAPNSTEHAHGQLQHDDECDLEVEKVVIRACSREPSEQMPYRDNTL